MSNHTETLADSFETFIRTNIDSKGRVFGYVVGLREVVGTGEYYAWVQRAVETKKGFEDFGVSQRSKKFRNLQEAKSWAYRTAKERAEKVAA